MDFDLFFSKSIKASIQEFKSTAQQMISNGCQFSCQTMNISVYGSEETFYPKADDLSKWVKTFMQVELKPKPLNQKALDEMAKKGIQPKKQITELILVCVISSTSHIHIGVYIPDSMLEKVIPVDFTSSSLSTYKYDMTFDSNYCFANIEHPDSLKERDNVLRCFFAELKKRNIYVADNDDDEVVNYLE